ncbi:hypothetical protein AMATHDRAFT_50638 [Amanita thiersii Skay4041]|uniref:Uncharacterized protein n=1 Tax=Amanita thiersii Skay4041 TaxID=703135 RepID=A0A2A9NGR9_9AGAR|nr:hypothetical protein AMATHDRAFT_50638 [Amanita thiersii Skay4041]
MHVISIASTLTLASSFAMGIVNAAMPAVGKLSLCSVPIYILNDLLSTFQDINFNPPQLEPKPQYALEHKVHDHSGLQGTEAKIKVLTRKRRRQNAGRQNAGRQNAGRQKRVDPESVYSELCLFGTTVLTLSSVPPCYYHYFCPYLLCFICDSCTPANSHHGWITAAECRDRSQRFFSRGFLIDYNDCRLPEDVVNDSTWDQARIRPCYYR